nr:hypothetical protein BaRGS_024145 [Batillaria attramentaria]
MYNFDNETDVETAVNELAAAANNGELYVIADEAFCYGFSVLNPSDRFSEFVTHLSNRVPSLHLWAAAVDRVRTAPRSGRYSTGHGHRGHDLQYRDTAILCPAPRDDLPVVSRLRARGVPVQVVTSDDDEAAIRNVALSTDAGDVHRLVAKMKRAKNEQIRNAVTQYLKRRQYQGTQVCSVPVSSVCAMSSETFKVGKVGKMKIEKKYVNKTRGKSLELQEPAPSTSSETDQKEKEKDKEKEKEREKEKEKEGEEEVDLSQMSAADVEHGGFEDSAIRLWRLQPELLPTRRTDCSNSIITLAADDFFKEEEEQTVNM